MRITLDISARLLQQANRLAADQDMTLAELVELGLRRVISAKRQTRTFTLRKASFRGNGLQPGWEAASWEGWRECAYKGRGG